MRILLIIIIQLILFSSVPSFCSPLCISSEKEKIRLIEIDKVKIFNSISFNNNDSLPEFPDLFFEYRITELNNNTPLDLEFNTYVKKYIQLYTSKRREQVSKVIGLSEYYFPIFEEYLDKYELPLELKYLPVVESALNPTARSTSGAMGLWQFKYNSAKMFDLKINSYVDERCDPVKSTDAACKYLKYLFGIFNDWNLAIAAYNTGPGVVRNIIERSGGEENFWKLYDKFPEEAGNYVSAFIAANYIMNFYEEHEIVAVGPKISFFETDTVHIKHSIHFTQITDKLGIPIDIIKFLNPQFKLDYIPVNGTPINFVLPNGYVLSFIKNEAEIYGSINDEKGNGYVKKKEIKSKKIIHVVKKGEFLHKIALQYHCTIENIKQWNSLSGDTLQEGQSLTIYVEKDFFK
ncbi:transglycosylase SLT domain-containing protein [Bacteroidota bacterium]